MTFEPLEPRHYRELAPYFERQTHPLAVYSLSSLIAWSQCIYDSFFAVEDGAALFAERRMDDPGRGHLLLPVCPEGFKPPAWIHARAAAAGYREVHGVSRDYLDAFPAEIPPLFSVGEQTDMDDYVYRVGDLAELPGRAYAKKRNLIRQFERERAGAAEIRPIDPDSAPECLACLETWRRERGAKAWSDILECERRAIGKALRGFEALGFKGIMIRIDGRAEGFGIGSRLTEDTWALNFEKASDRVKGLYQYLDRECARRLFPGARFINKESDLGDPGLAQAKESYHPMRRVKAYTLTLL